MKKYQKKIFHFNGLYLILMSSFFKCPFSALFKISIKGTPVHRSLPFFSGYFIYRALKLHSKNQISKSKTMVISDCLRKGSKYTWLKNWKVNFITQKNKNNFFLEISPIYNVLTTHFRTPKNFQHLNIVSIYLKR
jgi:hypothetical protein